MQPGQQRRLRLLSRAGCFHIMHHGCEKSSPTQVPSRKHFLRSARTILCPDSQARGEQTPLPAIGLGSRCEKVRGVRANTAPSQRERRLGSYLVCLGRLSHVVRDKLLSLCFSLPTREKRIIFARRPRRGVGRWQ